MRVHGLPAKSFHSRILRMPRTSLVLTTCSFRPCGDTGPMSPNGTLVSSDRKGYQEGLVAWFNSKYLALMTDKGRGEWPAIEAILAAP